MRLKDKIAIITGAGSGIGRATALLFAAEGASVVVADRNADTASETVDLITGAGGKAIVSATDVSNAAEVQAMVALAVATWGRIDILVNNAGYGITGTVVTTPEEDWTALMAVNVNGVFLGCKYTIPVMQGQGGGVIVNVASAVSAVGIADRAAYVASKGAVASLTRAMALDHAADNIRVNSVGPGTIESPYYDKIFAESPDAAQLRRGLEARQILDRLGKPEEIARAILFLASDDATFVTGSVMYADGGWTAR